MILLLSVPHTGTHFLMKFLNHLNVDYVTKHVDDDKFNKELAHLIGEVDYIIIPLRNPDLAQATAIRKNAKYADIMGDYWETLYFHIATQRDKVILFDVQCPKKFRNKMIGNILKALNVPSNSDLKRFVNAWEPINSSLTQEL